MNSSIQPPIHRAQEAQSALPYKLRLERLQSALARLQLQCHLSEIRFCGVSSKSDLPLGNLSPPSGKSRINRLAALEKEVLSDPRVWQASNSSLQAALIDWLRELRELQEECD